MNLGILNQTVFLIDTEFLNRKINENLALYMEINPDRRFETIFLADLLNHFILNAGLEEKCGHADILFAYKLSNPILIHCEPNNVFDLMDNGKSQFNNNKILIRSFFADTDESCAEHFINMLRIITFSSKVLRIVMIADNALLDKELEELHWRTKKSLFIFKNSCETEITIPIDAVNINTPICHALGLSDYERIICINHP